jgi:cytochrome c oxidase cbb3-type subunit I
MTVTVYALLALSFLISVLGLFMFIWAQMNGLMRAGPDAAGVIFADGEVGFVEDPSERAALQRVKKCRERRRTTTTRGGQRSRRSLMRGSSRIDRAVTPRSPS